MEPRDSEYLRGYRDALRNNSGALEAYADMERRLTLARRGGFREGYAVALVSNRLIGCSRYYVRKAKAAFTSETGHPWKLAVPLTVWCSEWRRAVRTK